jgi:flagellar biosynthetic protein FliR
MELAQEQWVAWLAVLARIGAALAVAPPFAHVAVPRRVRAVLAIALSIGLSPTVSTADPQSAGAIALAIGGEVLIGLALGLAISLVFTAAAWAGEIVSHQLGLNLPEAYDPRGGSEGTPLGQAYWLLTAVVFLAANGHHALIRALSASFDTVPALSAIDSHAAAMMFTGLLHSATVLAIQLAAPVFVATLIADVAVGLAGRTIPQLGVMTAGLTFRAVAGLIVLSAGVAVTVAVLQGASVNWMQIVQSAFAGLGR